MNLTVIAPENHKSAQDVTNGRWGPSGFNDNLRVDENIIRGEIREYNNRFSCKDI